MLVRNIQGCLLQEPSVYVAIEAVERDKIPGTVGRVRR